MFEEEKEELYLESELEVIHYFDTIGKVIEFLEYVFQECAALIEMNKSNDTFIPPIILYSSTYSIDERFLSTMVVSFLNKEYQVDSTSNARLVKYFREEHEGDESSFIKRHLYVTVFGDFFDLTPPSFKGATTAFSKTVKGKQYCYLTKYNYHSVINNGKRSVNFMPVTLYKNNIERYMVNFGRDFEALKTVDEFSENLKTVAFGFKQVKLYWAQNTDFPKREVFTFNLN